MGLDMLVVRQERGIVQQGKIMKSDTTTLVLGGALFGLVYAVLAWAML
jgi:hypothetical protein